MANRSLGSVIGASLLFGMSSGLTTNLWAYMTAYFWELEPSQTAAIAGALGISAAAAAATAPALGRRQGKRNAALLTGCCAAVCAPTPVLLRLAGFMPPNRSTELFRTLLGFAMFESSLWIQTQILTASMLADVVDDAEAKTGRRTEGMLFGLQTFARKSVNGLGLLAAGAVLSLAAFPRQSRPGSVDQPTIRHLGALSVICTTTLTLCGLAVLSTYSIDREAHEENLAEALRRRKGSDLSLHSRHSSDPPELGADDAADDSGEPLVGRCSGLEP